MISQKLLTIRWGFFSKSKQSFVENMFENLPAVKLCLGTPVKKTNIFQKLPIQRERWRERERKKEQAREIIEFND